jgi:hypothetical protein
MKRNMGDRLSRFAFAFSALALLFSIFTFVKTGGIGDIKRQVSIIHDDLSKARQQSEDRMANRSLLLEAIYDLSDSVDSLHAGNEAQCRELLENGVKKIMSVEPRLEERKRAQLQALRADIESTASGIRAGEAEEVKQLEYQIRLLRIFEENL